MDKEEARKIYTLLAQYYPHARQLRDKLTLTAWGYVLERFAYSDVKDAVIGYAAKNKFFPDLSDLTAGLTPLPTDRETAAAWEEIRRMRLLARRMGAK